MTEAPCRVLIAAFNGLPTNFVLDVGEALAAPPNGECVLLGVAEVPEDRSLSEGAMAARRRRNALQRIASERQSMRVEVRTGHTIDGAVREAAGELGTDVLVAAWQPRSRSASATALDRIAAEPPCDIALIKEGLHREIETVLVPVRGGPHAELAIRVAESVALRHGAVLTLLHVVGESDVPSLRAAGRLHFDRLRDRVSYDRVDTVELPATDVQSALLEEAAKHDLVVMGAAARDQKSSYVLGTIPETVARKTECTTIIVKTREPVTAATFGMTEEPKSSTADHGISALVDRWFAQNTFHSSEFRNLDSLTRLKERQGVSISVALPTLNEEQTVGKIISTIQRRLMVDYPLVDQLVVIDSESHDNTVEIAENLGVPVFEHPDVLPDTGTYRGKGEGLWKSLQVTTGDIVVWIDSDITGLHPKFVYGLIGPLLTQPRLAFVKGYYRRPLRLGGELLTTGGGRVTELTARPLINLFFPELSGLVQPLAGEMAGRRSVLEAVPMFTGYGVETGLLIDVLERFGLESIAQVDLQERVHRNQSLLSLSKMAFAIVQVVIKRLGQRDSVNLYDAMNQSMKLIHYSPTELFLEVQDIEEHERPPIVSLEHYRSSHQSRRD